MGKLLFLYDVLSVLILQKTSVFDTCAKKSFTWYFLLDSPTFPNYNRDGKMK